MAVRNRLSDTVARRGLPVMGVALQSFAVPRTIAAMWTPTVRELGVTHLAVEANQPFRHESTAMMSQKLSRLWNPWDPGTPQFRAERAVATPSTSPLRREVTDLEDRSSQAAEISDTCEMIE